MVGFGAEYDAKRRIVVPVFYRLVEHAHIHIHLPHILMGNAAGFQINQHKAFEDKIVKNQINEVIAGVGSDEFLSFNECVSFAQFQEKMLQVINDGFFYLAFRVAQVAGQVEEFQYAGVLDEFVFVLLKCRRFFFHFGNNRLFDL